MYSKQKAIIIGGGISGKLAARVLSDYFKEIIVLERDHQPKGPSPRNGAPQGKHLHALLHAGQYGLEELFPGITEKFHLNGAVKINSTKDLTWFHHGVWKLRYDGGYSTTLQTRPHLEWHIEQYIKEIPNISLHYNVSVKNYLYDEVKNCVYGVEIKSTDHSIKSLNADLIVDASGAGSLTTSWLKKRAIHIPHEQVQIGLSYCSKSFFLPEREERDWSIKLIYPTPPHEKIGGTISKVEGNQYIVTLIGYLDAIIDKEVLMNEQAFLELSRKLPKMDIYNEIKDGVPLSNASIYRIPQIIWRRFDRVKELPKGLLLMGDSVCRIDPVFGQGMSISVLEALSLQKLLSQQKHSLHTLVPKFHKKISKMISPIWNMVITEDFRYPGITGKKPIGLSIQQWYARSIFLLSSQNEIIYNSFIKVMNLVQPTTILLHPNIFIRVIRGLLSNKGEPKR